MPICKLCDRKFPNWKKIDDKKRNLRNRKYCLDCSPFGCHNTSKLVKPRDKNNTPEKRQRSIHYGKQCVCSTCSKKYLYDKSKGHTLSMCNSCVVLKSRGNLKERAVKYKGGKCEKCGYNKCIACLCFHHLDPNEKDFGIGSGYHNGWKTLKKEIEKCILLCTNCHGELHYNKKQ